MANEIAADYVMVGFSSVGTTCSSSGTDRFEVLVRGDLGPNQEDGVGSPRGLSEGYQIQRATPLLSPDAIRIFICPLYTRLC